MGHSKDEAEFPSVGALRQSSSFLPNSFRRVFPMRRIRCRPLRMPQLFNWGDTTLNWSRAVEDYQKIARYNRMCDLMQRRQRQE
jgi:hypothetical protein